MLGLQSREQGRLQYKVLGISREDCHPETDEKAKRRERDGE
jgi:hypothetical protein